MAQQPAAHRSKGSRQGLAWVVDDSGVCWHTGGTSGFSSCLVIDHGRGRAIAALVARGGSPVYASRLSQAARIALADGDPRQAAEPEPWPSWREDAENAVRALLAGRVAQVHARLAAPRREKVSVRQLERAWNSIVPDSDPSADVAIGHYEIAPTGAVVAEMTITTSGGSHRLRMVILATGELGGLGPGPAGLRLPDPRCATVLNRPGNLSRPPGSR